MTSSSSVSFLNLKKMKYYKIKRDSNPKVIGIKDGSYQVEILREMFENKSNFDTFYETYIKLVDGKVAWRGLMNIEVIIEYAELRKGAFTTDLLAYIPFIFDGGQYIVSEDLLALFSKFKIATFKSYSVPMYTFEGKRLAKNYFLLHMPMLQYDYIDFDKSVFYYEDERFNKIYIKFNSEREYKDFGIGKLSCYFSSLYLNKKFDRSLDIFTLRGGGVDYIVSERVKVEIEKSKLKGLMVLEDGDPFIFS